MARTTGSRVGRAPRAHRVVCRDCGGEFSSRGIATHRRLKHGPPRPAEPAPEPAPSVAEPDPTAVGPADSAVNAGPLDSAENAGPLDSAEIPIAEATAGAVAAHPEVVLPAGLAARLDGLAEALQRIEARLAALEGVGPCAAPLAGAAPAPPPPRSERARLEGELDGVLTAIAAKDAAARELAAAEPATATERAALREIHRELGGLRRRQLWILMRLGPDAPGAPPGWGVGGFGA